MLGVAGCGGGVMERLGVTRESHFGAEALDERDEDVGVCEAEAEEDGGADGGADDVAYVGESWGLSGRGRGRDGFVFLFEVFWC